MRTKNLLISIPLLLLLAGCASKPAIQGVPILGTDPGARQAEMQLSQSAQSINGSLQELAQIKRATYPHVRMPSPPNANRIGMAHTASIDWSGPIQPLVKNIAKITGYRLRVLGRAPAIPVLVSISEHKVSLATILRNAAYQCGNKVDILVYPKSRILELRYARV